VILHALVEDGDGARAAVDGGATVVQLRLKGAPTGVVVERGRAVRDLCAAHNVLFVVNDDVEAAVALAADGVHLGRDDDGLERARERGLLVGLSAQTLDEAVAVDSERPDYIGAGPVWPTPTKRDAAAIGLEGLRAICAAVSAPVVAIGGIDASNAPDCLAAGAGGIAVVRAAADAAAVQAALARATV
jgi:thiamine-phosphate pyrophosphorylase